VGILKSYLIQTWHCGQESSWWISSLGYNYGKVIFEELYKHEWIPAVHWGGILWPWGRHRALQKNIADSVKERFWLCVNSEGGHLYKIVRK